MSLPALDTAPPGASPSVAPSTVGPIAADTSPGSRAVAGAGVALRRLWAALSRGFHRGAAFVRWLVASIVDVTRRTLARVGLTMLGGVMLIIVLIGLALTIRSFKPRG